MTLGELLNIEAKQNSMTLQELQIALQGALSNPIIKKQPPICATITTVLTALIVYNTAITIYNTIQTMTPSIKLASKTAGIPLNPSLASEVSLDAITLAQSTMMKTAINGLKTLKNSILNIEISNT